MSKSIRILPFTNTSSSEESSVTFRSKPSEKIRCAFCGGQNCNRCGDNAYLQLESPAINKLHSTWITSSILAMQRPSDNLFENGLLERFVNVNISAVFNLTEAGEHPYCGNGILLSGFPYTPEKLMAVGINHFNYSWPDMSVPAMSMMNDIVSVAIKEISTGKNIAIHCHAG